MSKLKLLFLGIVVCTLQSAGYAQEDYSIDQDYSTKLGEDGGIGKLIFNTEFSKYPKHFEKIIKPLATEVEREDRMPINSGL
ncbi:MAG: hypothetical protein ACI865_002013 [Flavobacteriaceae bacterium]|jgi:hypothetical protein